ncbi:MAG: ABC transporter ATP-binding protein [Firmicutes bacterium]|nr:ABC transporter ATP-binding protein [Bacillota bacterium]
MTAELVLEDVHVDYGGVAALKGVSLSVREGELVCLLGANGAGKSTTLRTISGLVRPRRGEVRFAGERLQALSPYQIVARGIVHCPEGRHIFGGLTVQENLMLGAVQRRDAAGVRRDLDWVLALFPDLAQRLKQRGATLSGGQQQMLAIARALMARPRILLLDEPSLGLAPVVVQTIFRVIRDLHRQGTTILLVEQNARQALAIADRGYVLESGRIVSSGTRAELEADVQIEKAYLGA